MHILFILLSFFSLACSFNLALDVGHTKINYGALSASCKKEYLFNSELVEYIKENTNAKLLHIATNLNKNDITFDQRYNLSKNKDLFISIHHDSVQKQFIHYDSNNCPKTNYAKGYSIFISNKNKYYEKSLYFARKFALSLKKSGLQHSTHHHEKIKGENRELIDEQLGIYIFDDLKVLKNANAPAFLFEAGVIVNPSEEQLVQSIEFRKKIAKAINDMSLLR